MESFESQSLIMGQRLRELRTARHLSFEALKKALMEKYNISISIDSLKNYEVSQSWHTKAAQKEGMSIKYLRCFADFYGVSSDYLLGMDVPQTPDVSVREMIEKTGLSEKAIEHLCITQNSHSELTPVLNLILEEPFFFEFLNGIGKCIGAAKATAIVNGIQGELFHQNEISLGHIEDFEHEYANQLSVTARNSQHGYFTNQYLEKYAAQAFFYISKPESEQEALDDLLSELSQLSFSDLCEYRSTIELSHLLNSLNRTQSLKSQSEI